MRIETPRLILRPWREDDLAPVAEITADPEVMRHFHVTRSRAQSDGWVARTQARIDALGYGIWAVEAKGVGLIGFAGLTPVLATLPCAPAVEAVWTFGQPWWRQGYCTEAARAAIADGFTRVGLAEIVAFTATSNAPSEGVMRKLGMVRDLGGDFDHPGIPAGHPLARHVLYRLARPEGAAT